jgi:hypothetical protein
VQQAAITALSATTALAVALSSLGAIRITPQAPSSPVTTSSSRHPEAVLSNGPLRVRLYLPDPDRGFYRSTRFDWSGIVAGLEHQGHEYYSPWFTGTDTAVRDFIYKGAEIVAAPQSAITGPAEEFPQPQGFAAAAPGGTFVKVGVGVLRKKDDGTYSAYNHYDIVSTGQWTVEQGADWIEFAQQVADQASGYAYEYRKTLRTPRGKPVLVIEHRLRNTGRLPIETTQYNHNFLTLDRVPTGPDLAITLPFQIQTTKPPDPAFAEIRGNQIVYTRTLAGEDRVFFPIQGFGKSANDYDIRVDNRRTGAGLRITGDRPLARVSLWSIRSVMSVEPFVDVTTPPGQTTAWTYTYTYFKNKQ